MSIFTPVNQIRLTNVAVVRLKKGGKRFELACYPNKVIPWRDGIEKDLGEVMQSEHIFTNVSKGTVAKKNELQQCFNSTDAGAIIKEILTKGELQVSEKERQSMNEKLFRDIATVVAEKCVDPETNRPLTVALVERAMKEIHFAAKPNKAAKQQALAVIRLLKDKIPIQRAQMRLQVTMTAKDGRRSREKVMELVASVEKEEWREEQDQLVLTVLIDPGAYRDVDELVRKQTKGTGSVEVLSLCVVEEGEQKIE